MNGGIDSKMDTNEMDKELIGKGLSDRMNRELDGVYFRIKRNEEWDNICFSDLTEEEMNEVLEGKNLEFCKNLAIIMGKTLRQIGDEMDIVNSSILEDE